MPTFRAELARARALSRAKGPVDPEAPVPPPLPVGTAVPIPGRGELFVRHARAEAPGLPVLLLHGWTWTAELNWWSCFDAVPAEHPVLAPDHRGHGRSLRAERAFTLEDAADDHAALLDALGIERAIVVGFSMGGPIGLTLARRHPEKVAGIVCMATALEFHAGGPWWRARWRALPLIGAAVRLGPFERGTAKYLRWAAEQDADFAPHRAWAAGEWRRQSATDINQAGHALARFDARPWLDELPDVPRAVVHTTGDRLVQRKRQRALAAALGADLLKLDADHDCPFTASRQMGVVVGDAVRRVAARAAAAPGAAVERKAG